MSTLMQRSGEKHDLSCWLQVDRFLVEESRNSVGTKSVTLELSPSFSPKRSRPVSHETSCSPRLQALRKFTLFYELT